MRDPQGREIVRSNTAMRAAFTDALYVGWAAPGVRSPERSALLNNVEATLLAGAGRPKAPAWSVSRKA